MRYFNIRKTILTNLIAIFIVLNVPVYVMNLYMTHHAEQNILKRSTDAISINARYFLENFAAEIERIDRLKNEYLTNDDFLKLANEGPYLDPYSKSNLILSVKEKLGLLRSSSPFVQDVKVYFPSLHRGVFANSYENIISSEEVQRMKDSYRSDTMLYGADNSLTLGGVYPVPLLDDDFAHSIEIVLSRPIIEQMLSKMRDADGQQGGGALLYSQVGGWAISDRGDWLDNSHMSILTKAFQSEDKDHDYVTVTLDEEKYMVMKEASSVLGTELFVTVPEAEFTGILSRYNYIFYTILVASLLLVFLFAYWIYRLIHQPFQQLLAGLRRVEKGDYEVNLLTRKGDEFSIVYRQFNSMASRLNTLIKEVYEQRIRLQVSELKQLQSQINPHFLYNSYYAIYRLAQRQDTEKVAIYTRYLGDYFKYITRNSSDMVMLVDEMTHAEAYVRIQTLRFYNRISTELEPLPETVDQLMVPKLILQPIIENAYTHGLNSKLEQGLVRIAFTQQNEILSIIVEDNGDELTDEILFGLDERLKRINDNLIDETTGMLNVHKRLQLKFGLEYGISGSRSKLGGLKVEIIIPISNAQSDERHKENNDV